MSKSQTAETTESPTQGARAERIEQLLRRAVERGGYMTNADLLDARELLRDRPAA